LVSPPPKSSASCEKNEVLQQAVTRGQRGPVAAGRGTQPGPRHSDGPAAQRATELKAKIMKEVEAFSHGEFRDDVTVVVACIR
jgi:hypothetical protein